MATRTQTIVLQNNKLQYKEYSGDTSTEPVNFNFNSTTIQASAPILAATGDLTVAGNSAITQNLSVTGTSNLTGNLTVSTGSLNVIGDSNLKKLVVDGNAQVNQNLMVILDSTLNGNFTVEKDSNLKGFLTVHKDSEFKEKLTVIKDSDLKGSLSVLMTSNLGALNVNSGQPTNLTGNLMVTGASILNNTFTVQNALTTLHTLIVNNESTLNSTLTVKGRLSLDAGLGVGGIDGLTVYDGATTIKKALDVDGKATMNNMQIWGNTKNHGDLEVTVGNFNVIAGESKLHKLEVTTLSTLKGGLNVTGDSYLSGNLDVTGEAKLGTLTASSFNVDNLVVKTESNLNILKANASTLKSLEVTLASNLKGDLTVDGDSTLKGDLTVSNGGNMVVSEGQLTVSVGKTTVQALDVNGTTKISGSLEATGSASFQTLTVNQPNGATLNGAVFSLNSILDATVAAAANLNVLNANESTLKSLEVTNASKLKGTLEVNGAFTANGASTLNSTLAVTGASTLSDKLTITAGGMDVTGASTVRGDLTVIQTAHTDLRGTLNVGGTSTLGVLNGGQASLGATTLHSLEVTNASNLKGNLNVGNDLQKANSKFFGDLEIKGNFTVHGEQNIVNVTTTNMQISDKNIDMGHGNTGDNDHISLNMCYGNANKKAGLRRNKTGGFILFKECVNPDTDANPSPDTLIVDTLECFSDMNLKKNIVTIDGALDKIDGIRGVYHDWINTKQSEDRQIGVIAQEIQAVYPELVHENENGYLSVNYPKLTAVLLQSIKELKAMVLAICAKQA